jgi:hypothetical protein
VIVLPIEREPGDGEEGPACASDDAEKERPVSPNAPSDDSKGDTNKHKKHLVSKRKYYHMYLGLDDWVYCTYTFNLLTCYSK